MRKFLLLFVFVPGCMAMIDPAHYGTPAMKRAWAKADLCVQVCDARHPNDKMVLAARVGNDCVCQTTHVYMGASYYGDDHAPEPVDQYERVKLPATFEESVAQVDAAVKALANASCVVKAREQLQQKQRIE